jgi:two-component system phosphate regulon response regulator PhoB
LAAFLQGASRPADAASRAVEGSRQTGALQIQGLGCPSSVQGIVYKFESFAALTKALDTEEPDVKLPTPTGDGLVDGQWLVATFTIGNDATSVAGRVADRGSELHLTFEARDWNQLCRFANGECPPSIPPPCLEGAEVVSAPPGTTVLVVDDDPTLRSIVCTMLRASDVTTLQLESAEEALDWLAKKHADLLVLDWGLPGMNGVELCARLRKDPEHRTLPILFLTGHSSSSDLVEAFEAGADDFVSKPFRAPELRARVLGLLRRVGRERIVAAR